MAIKGFIKDWKGQRILPITRAELVLDQNGNPAFTSALFEAGHVNADGTVNQYGLISAAERALITGGSTGQGISDIYTKLGQINSGLYFNNTALKFYDADGKATPIKVNSVGDGALAITLNGNDVNLGLTDLKVASTITGQILKNITVDNFGRVIAVSGGALLDSEIPDTLTGKTLVNGILDGCTITTVGESTDSIPNKAYVDQKFATVTGMATGALKFGGPLNDATTANNALTNKDSWNNYYKVTTAFNIAASDVYEYSGSDDTVSVKIGDTLIIYSPISTATRAQFVHIPSGDDITSITVKGDDNTDNAVNDRINKVRFRFSHPFDVTSELSGNGAYIKLHSADATHDGYLSKEDWIKFNSYASTEATTYEGVFKQIADGIYKIGTLSIGGVAQDILGKINISSLTLVDGATNEYNPVLRFSETGASDVDITFNGIDGIGVRKNGNAIEFKALNEVSTDSAKYLEIESGYKFKVKKGSVVDNEVVDGLTDYREFAEFRSNVLVNGVQFEEVSTSLNDTSGTYYYGSQTLKTAISLTI